MAVSKERKEEIVAKYQGWLGKSQAVIMTEFVGLSMKNLDELRRNIREVGGEFHILKNTLGIIAFENSGLVLPEGYFEGSTAAGFAYDDAPGLAKAMTDFSNEVEFLKIKGGYLEAQPVSAEEIKVLAKVPPLPIMRAHLLGTIVAPASKLARTLAEPARQVASVLKAYADKDASPASAQ